MKRLTTAIAMAALVLSMGVAGTVGMPATSAQAAPAQAEAGLTGADGADTGAGANAAVDADAGSAATADATSSGAGDSSAAADGAGSGAQAGASADGGTGSGTGSDAGAAADGSTAVADTSGATGAESGATAAGDASADPETETPDTTDADAGASGDAGDAGADAIGDGSVVEGDPADETAAAPGDGEVYDQDGDYPYGSALLKLQGETRAEAANLAGFKAGNIISDANFYGGYSMNTSQIQAFLNQRMPRCEIGDPGRKAYGPAIVNGKIVGTIAGACMKDAKWTSNTIPADSYCSTISGGTAQSSATIIAKVAQACSISPKVLLVMLEKEQSLVGDTWPTLRQYDVAMGYDCPDTGPNYGANCDPTKMGFPTQVHKAARQLQVYKANAGIFNYKPQQMNTILWHPNPACGTSQVYIENYATAALYIYTPYRPNQAALNAGWGTGDACSTYGNRNFYNFYNTWFGSPTDTYYDVPAHHPFSKHIEWMAAKGYAASGDGAAYFNPTSATSRGAMATFMRRIYEPNYTPSKSFKMPFKDVPKSNVHYDSIAWLVERGYVAKADKYNPGNATTRGAMATFLYRMENGARTSTTTKTPYRDVPTTNPHAKAIAWMAKKGYSASGASNPTFNPGQAMKRQAIAAFLYRIKG